MLSAQEPQGIQHNSDQENLLHLIEMICPRDVTESVEAYRVFCEFALNEKTIRGIATEQGVEIQTVKSWAEDFHWIDRVKEWKSIFHAYQRKQWELREKAIMQRWNDRRERFLQVADELLAKADVMLRHPHVQKFIHEEVVAEYKGQIIPTQIVITPVKWHIGDIAALQKTALGILEQVVGDREIMIDRLTSDGYVITEFNGNDEIESYVVALNKLEQLQRGF